MRKASRKWGLTSSNLRRSFWHHSILVSLKLLKRCACSILGSTGTRYHYAWPDKGHSTKTTRSCGNSNDLAKVMSKCHGRGLEELGLWILAANRKHNVRISEVQVKRWIFGVMESMFFLFFPGSHCTFWVRGGHCLEQFHYVMYGFKIIQPPKCTRQYQINRF